MGFLAFHPFLVGIKEHCGYGSHHISVADVSVNDFILFVFLILLNRSLLYVFVIVSSCCLIKYVTHLCFFLFWGSWPVCDLVYFVVSWWNRWSLYLCSFPHQSNTEHSFLFVVFLVSCLQLFCATCCNVEYSRLLLFGLDITRICDWMLELVVLVRPCLHALKFVYCCSPCRY